MQMPRQRNDEGGGCAVPRGDYDAIEMWMRVDVDGDENRRLGGDDAANAKGWLPAQEGPSPPVDPVMRSVKRRKLGS